MNEVEIVDAPNAGEMLKISGTYPQLLIGCMMADDIRTQFSDSGETLRIIMNAKVATPCPPGYQHEFTYEIALKDRPVPVQMLSVRQSAPEEILRFVR